MDGPEIKARIDALNKIIYDELNPSFFILNRKIEEAKLEIEKLKVACEHIYDENNHCIYCGKEK